MATFIVDNILNQSKKIEQNLNEVDHINHLQDLRFVFRLIFKNIVASQKRNKPSVKLIKQDKLLVQKH